MKYFITELSMKSLKKKYKKSDLKEQNKENNPKTTKKNEIINNINYISKI